MSEEKPRPVGCPECGGEMLYERSIRRYVCKSCGLTLTSQELLVERKKIFERTEEDDRKRERERKEYLKWWLSSKKEK